MKRKAIIWKESLRGTKRRKLRHDDASDGPSTDDNFHATQNKKSGRANKPDKPLVAPDLTMLAKSKGQPLGVKKRQLDHEDGPDEPPVDAVSNIFSTSGEDHPHGTKREDFHHRDTPDGRPVSTDSITSTTCSKGSPHGDRTEDLCNRDSPDEPLVDVLSSTSPASGRSRLAPIRRES